MLGCGARGSGRPDQHIPCHGGATSGTGYTPGHALTTPSTTPKHTASLAATVYHSPGRCHTLLEGPHSAHRGMRACVGAPTQTATPCKYNKAGYGTPTQRHSICGVDSSYSRPHGSWPPARWPRALGCSTESRGGSFTFSGHGSPAACARMWRTEILFETIRPVARVTQALGERLASGHGGNDLYTRGCG